VERPVLRARAAVRHASHECSPPSLVRAALVAHVSARFGDLAVGDAHEEKRNVVRGAVRRTSAAPGGAKTPRPRAHRVDESLGRHAAGHHICGAVAALLPPRRIVADVIQTERLDLMPLGPGSTADEKDALVAFLTALTDDRVRLQQAPFDHPQLFVPDGHRGDTTSVATDAGGTAVDEVFELPAVGAAGGAPLAPFRSPHPAAAVPPIDVEPVVAPAPTSVQLGSVQRGKTADAQVVVNSAGAGTLEVNAATIEGTDAAEFSVAAGTCGASPLPKNASCTITVRFKPRGLGPRAAQLVIADNAVDSPLRIDLAGTGS
jgi:hypothetical protein